MKTVWYEGARSDDAKKERQAVVLSGAGAFEILTGILEAKVRWKETERNRVEGYKLPAYSESQADASGYIRAMREVQSLLDLQESK